MKKFSNPFLKYSADVLRANMRDPSVSGVTLKKFERELTRLEKAQDTLDEAEYVYENHKTIADCVRAQVPREVTPERRMLDLIAGVIMERKDIISQMEISHSQRISLEAVNVIMVGIGVALSQEFPNNFSEEEFREQCRPKKAETTR
jgi:hypothetical protein